MEDLADINTDEAAVRDMNAKKVLKNTSKPKQAMKVLAGWTQEAAANFMKTALYRNRKKITPVMPEADSEDGETDVSPASSACPYNWVPHRRSRSCRLRRQASPLTR